ncbi:MAG TPA: class I SAM-dependent methyltransferase [bacterium]|nr:class I SAM-dependent methyltransferase [bacterium]
MPGSNAEPWIVTTPRKREDLEEKARETARRTGVPFVRRNEVSVKSFFEDAGLVAMYIEAAEAPIIQTRKGSFYYHENTAGMRTKIPGRVDAVIRALGVEPGDTVLDCTLGIGCDALVAATALETGTLTGIEVNPLLADLVRRGLENYEYSSEKLAAAASRIKVINSDYGKFLAGCEENVFDVVYFDPMFALTVEASPSMQRIRELAEKEPLAEGAIEAALRAARKRVVIKGRRGCFGSLRFDSIVPSGRTVFYGIIEK